MVDARDATDRVPMKPFVGFGPGTHSSLEEIAEELRRGDAGRRATPGSKVQSIQPRRDTKVTVARSDTQVSRYAPDRLSTSGSSQFNQNSDVVMAGGARTNSISPSPITVAPAQERSVADTSRAGIGLKRPLSIADTLPTSKSHRLSLPQPISIQSMIKESNNLVTVVPSTARTQLRSIPAYQDRPSPAYRLPVPRTSLYMSTHALLLPEPKAKKSQASKIPHVAGTRVEIPESRRASAPRKPRATTFSQAHLAYLMANPPAWPLPLRAMHGVHHELESNCTPVQVNITLCKMPLSAEEIMTYFPMHLKWYPIAVRLHSHGWTASNICHYIYWSRELKQKSTLERTRVQHMLARAGDHYKEKNPGTFKPEAIPANPSLIESTATSRLSPAAIHNYYLVDLAEGVKHHPEDRGRLGLTHAIEHACANGNNTVLLSQAHEYVVEHALFDITAEYDCNVEDLPARQRVHTKVSAYFSNLFGVSGASRGQRKVKETNAGIISFTETSEGDETNAKTSEDMDANKRPLELSSREDAGSGTQDEAHSGKSNNLYEEE